MYEAVPLSVADCERAGELMASRHVGERQRFPRLPSAYEDPQRCADLVRSGLSFSDGVRAIDSVGDIVGFLMSFDAVPDPSSPMARYSPERAAVHLVQAHAVSQDVAPGPVYGAMFAELAERALARRVTDHVVHVPLGNPAIEAAWVALGFGRVNAVAIRDLAPLDRQLPNDVDVRVAMPDELDLVDRLVDEESVFHARSPILRPYMRTETAAAVRAELAQQLASDTHAFLIARRDGVDVGVLSIAPGLGSPLCVPDGAAYIAATAVIPDARRSGAGTALVDAALTWCADHGYAAACLHFATANMTSTSFWTGVGFTPVMVHMRRRLDERILTHR